MTTNSKLLVLLTVMLSGGPLAAQLELKYEDGYSLTHDEVIEAYTHLTDTYLKCELREMGPSDSGRPIHLFTAGSMSENLPTVLINNAIHPGESCGVDASLMLVEQLLREDSPILDRINLAIIPMYNVGGALNRSCCTRANQEGPIEQGFRGNARYLDLNRDFIKADSRNARTFYRIFHELDPEILVDTHTSNGADYPYTMTLIQSQSQMIDQHLAHTYDRPLAEALYEAMEPHYPMVPYMNLVGRTPEQGIVEFPDWPRYSTGYAGLFNCYGFTTEAHMLKPYRDRVLATYHFLLGVTRYSSDHNTALVKNKQKADRNTLSLGKMHLDFELDTLTVDSIDFRGFEVEYLTSEVTGLERIRYDRSRIWEGKIPYWRNYLGSDEVVIPDYYYIPQAWAEVIERLEWNGVEMQRLEQDTSIVVESYYIESFESSERPYEGHYLHSEVITRTEKQEVNFFKGDYIVPTRQRAKRYLVNVLEPRAKDSFFAWGFFDAVLQQKEWFSPYVFEDMALDILNKDPELKSEFLKKKEEDEAFAKSMWGQLIYIYRSSEYYEEGHDRYPVFRSVEMLRE
ncbi:MAG: hypothetical protein HKN79_03500 [Flavobacteriales bacterium]|nr:hypothetical protein [Flavobacteriales bacterium]